MITADGNAFRTTASTSPALGANAPMLYTVRLSCAFGQFTNFQMASTASGIAMNGIRASGRTKQA